jgi:hypothetical protein
VDLEPDDGCAIACLPWLFIPPLYVACLTLCEGSDYGLEPRQDEPEAGVPRCLIVDPLNAGLAEVQHTSGPVCRARSGTGPGAPSSGFGLPSGYFSDVEQGEFSRSLPVSYARTFPSPEYPFDDPRAEWLYFRSYSDPGRVEGWGARASDALMAVAMLPYLAFEVLEEGNLVTESGAVRPQMLIRFWIGMIVSTQNLDLGTVSEGDDEGARVVEFLSHVEASSARIRTFRREGSGFIGHSATRSYRVESGDFLFGIVRNATGGASWGPLVTIPRDEYMAKVGGSTSVLGQILRGDVQITELAGETLWDPALRDQMILDGFACLVGEKVEFTYSIGIRASETDVGVTTSAVMHRCLTADDLEQVCDFLDSYDVLQRGDAGKFVFQSFDDANVQGDTASC